MFDDVMHCIFCRQEKPERATGEHVVPFSLGGSWTIPNVCEECDNHFGTTYDADLAKFTPLERRREDLRLAGHSGAVPNRMREALSQPVTVMGGSGRTARVFMEEHGVNARTKTIPLAKFVFSCGRDGGLTVGLSPDNVAIDPTNVEDTERILARRLREDAKAAGIPLTDEQVAYVVAHHAKAIERVEEDTTVEVRMQLRMSGHLGNLAKIAYEAARTWLGDTWLKDPMADAMRRHMMGDESIRISGREAFGPLHKLHLNGLEPTSSHVVTLLQNRQAGHVYVQLFDAVSAEFAITDNLRAYDPLPEHAVVLDAVLRKHRFVGSGSLFHGSAETADADPD